MQYLSYSIVDVLASFYVLFSSVSSSLSSVFLCAKLTQYSRLLMSSSSYFWFALGCRKMGLKHSVFCNIYSTALLFLPPSAFFSNGLLQCGTCTVQRNMGVVSFSSVENESFVPCSDLQRWLFPRMRKSSTNHPPPRPLFFFFFLSGDQLVRTNSTHQARIGPQ